MKGIGKGRLCQSKGGDGGGDVHTHLGVYLVTVRVGLFCVSYIESDVI